MNLIDELSSKVGSEIHVSDWLTIEQQRVDDFSKATGDFQWLHNDPVRAAKESPFGAPVVHGYLLLSLYPMMRDIVDEQRPAYSGVKTVVNYGSNKCRFPQAVKVGQRVRGHAVLTQVDEVPGGIQTIEQYTYEIEGEPRPACVAEVIMRYYL